MILHFYVISTVLVYLIVQDLHRGVEIRAANGKNVLAIKVFAHALRFFKEHCLQELSDQSATRILNDDIRWVITVPAIWQQPAKQFMRAAAYDVSQGPLSAWRNYIHIDSGIDIVLYVRLSLEHPYMAPHYM